MGANSLVLRRVTSFVETAGQALWRPAPERHCIWEIVGHIILWRRYLLAAMAGRPRPDWRTGDWRLPERTDETMCQITSASLPCRTGAAAAPARVSSHRVADQEAGSAISSEAPGSSPGETGPSSGLDVAGRDLWSPW